MKVYLDVCCLNRLTDDQTQAKVREEARAVEQVLAGVRSGAIQLISSEALEDESRRNPTSDRRLEAEAFLMLAADRVEIDDRAILRAAELVALGYGPYDALHIAAAESARVDALLTTDDRLIRRAARGLGNPQIPVRNPVSWMEEQGL